VTAAVIILHCDGQKFDGVREIGLICWHCRDLKPVYDRCSGEETVRITQWLPPPHYNKSSDWVLSPISEDPCLYFLHSSSIRKTLVIGNGVQVKI
jgi:hypothetical protein